MLFDSALQVLNLASLVKHSGTDDVFVHVSNPSTVDNTML